jgi:hypothetical protein
MTGFQSKRAMAQDKLEGQSLIDRVLDQLEDDIKERDFTAIEELLKFVPEENLIAYLPEENQ